jgi:hypothetical protein
MMRVLWLLLDLLARALPIAVMYGATIGALWLWEHEYVAPHVALVVACLAGYIVGDIRGMFVARWQQVRNARS